MLLLGWLCKPFARRPLGAALANDQMANAVLSGATFDVAAGGHLFVPYGEFPHARGVQRFDRAAAEELVTNFNKPWPRLKRLANIGTPIYIGHPDVPGQQHLYPDSKAYGWIESMQAEATGLRIVPKWSAPGARMISNAHYRYHSVYWDAVPDGKGGFRPCYLISVGLTNAPNIPVPALANDAGPTTEHPPMKLSPELLKLLGLEETADEAAVIQAVTALKSKVTAVENEVTQLKAGKTETDAAKAQAETAKAGAEEAKKALENAIAEVRKQRVVIALDRAVAEGRVLPCDREAESVRLVSLANDTALTTELDKLAALPVKVKTKSVTDGAAGHKDKALAPKRDTTLATAIANAVNEERQALERLYPGNPRNHELSYANARRKHPEIFAPQVD